MSRLDLAGAADRQRARFELLMRMSLELAWGDQCPDSEVRIIVLQHHCAAASFANFGIKGTLANL
jgi:hypothetical protein